MQDVKKIEKLHPTVWYFKHAAAKGWGYGLCPGASQLAKDLRFILTLAPGGALQMYSIGHPPSGVPHHEGDPPLSEHPKSLPSLVVADLLDEDANLHCIYRSTAD